MTTEGCQSAAAAHLTVLLRFVHCYRAIGMAPLQCYGFGSFRRLRSALMRLHIDRNHLDGNLIALMVITLLIAIAMVY